MADPGFFREGCAHSQIGIILQIVCKKCMKNERIWTPGDGPGVPLRSTNGQVLIGNKFEVYFKASLSSWVRNLKSPSLFTPSYQ